MQRERKEEKERKQGERETGRQEGQGGELKVDFSICGSGS